jgi:hypothetical protein
MKKPDVSKIETWENAFNLFKEGSNNDTIPIIRAESGISFNAD